MNVKLDAVAGDGEAGESDLVKTDIENVLGGSGNDTLTGGSKANVLSGGSGNDKLTGGAGNDIENGGDGNDTFKEGASASGADTFNGGAGVDRVDYSSRSVALNVTLDAAAK